MHDSSYKWGMRWGDIFVCIHNMAGFCVWIEVITEYHPFNLSSRSVCLPFHCPFCMNALWVKFWLPFAYILGQNGQSMSWMAQGYFGWMNNWHQFSLNTESDADMLLKDLQALWPCISWSWMCRQAPKAPWRSWSCQWCTLSLVSSLFFKCIGYLIFTFLMHLRTWINTTLVTLIKWVCTTSILLATCTGTPSSTWINYGCLCPQRRRRAWQKHWR